MLLIEELPTTTTQRVSHGWAYVPDTGAPIAAVQPGTRKRGVARETTSSRSRIDTTAKQQKAIQQRLEHLSRDNYRDNVDIPIPTRARDQSKKITPNVRRILQYHSKFRQYLEAQEAELSQTGATTVTLPPALDRTDSTKKDGRNARKSTTQQLPMHPPPRPRTSTAGIKNEPPSEDTDTLAPSSSPARATLQPTTSSPSSLSAPPPSPLPYDPLLDADPLLKTLSLPPQPSQRVLATLLAEPPLSYTAAAARPVDNPKPPRQFCVVCGYWGKVTCRKCGERTCGLMECWSGHQCLLY